MLEAIFEIEEKEKEKRRRVQTDMGKRIQVKQI